MRPRLVIIGDSFAQPSNDGSFYGFILGERFPEIDVIFDGNPSRDAQTIIDHWIKIIPELTSNDYLIVVFPTLGRTRLPIVEKHQTDILVGETKLVNRFKGTDSYSGEEIELFGDSFDRKYFYDLLIPQMAINSSKSSEYNFLEVTEALTKLTRCKKYVFCWRELDLMGIPAMDDRKALIRKMGRWITLHSEFVSTEGKKGFKDDLHWAEETHLAFSNFIAKRFELIKADLI
jgi:hypothetical protein